MKILIYSPLFYPSVGGLETIVGILAHEFVAQGHEVKLVTQVAHSAPDHFPFEVVRRPSPWHLLALVRWCEIYFHPTISLKGVWPLFFYRRAWVISHNNWYTRVDGRVGWQDHLKQFCTRFAQGISVSQAIAHHVVTPSIVINNPYQVNLFRVLPDQPRPKNLIFLGRLVSDKGADLLLDAMALLRRDYSLEPNLTIVGQGPEWDRLQRQVDRLELRSQVEFAGIVQGEALVALLNQHQILVVPSRWNEPFGIVALEGIACGCVVVGSVGGGLADAIGPCGLTFANGNIAALTGILADLLQNSAKLAAYQTPAPEHLARHQPARVAQQYLQVFASVLK